MTTVYLAWSAGCGPTLEKHRDDAPVDLLVSLTELRSFERWRSKINLRSWVLDSGAFAVFNSGRSIKLADYIAVAKNQDAKEIFALDVIGDARATRHNCEAMWARDIPAIPTVHIGGGWKSLEWCCAHSSKIALGGMARMPRDSGIRARWITQCFARAWPKRIHGFGLAGEKTLRLVPFHSVDATSWAFAPQAFGRWSGYSGAQLNLKTKGVNDFWVEVLEHQKRARWAAFRWRKELAML